LVWLGLAWSGLVWSGLVWCVCVCVCECYLYSISSVLARAPIKSLVVLACFSSLPLSNPQVQPAIHNPQPVPTTGPQVHNKPLLSPYPRAPPFSQSPSSNLLPFRINPPTTIAPSFCCIPVCCLHSLPDNSSSSIRSFQPLNSYQGRFHRAPLQSPFLSFFPPPRPLRLTAKLPTSRRQLSQFIPKYASIYFIITERYQLIMRSAALLLAVAGVYAQTTDPACSSSNGLTIQNQGDASQLAGCTSFTGSIKVAPQTSGTINFPTVRSISGDLNIDGATNITAIGADSLQSIGGKFTLNNLQLLTSLSFPQLTDVGDIAFTGLPNLSLLGFSKNIQQVKTLNIQNTFLSSLNGINLQNVNSIYVANNRMLQSLKFQVTKIAQAIILLSNGDQFDVAFPNLETAQNITIRTVKSVSIPSLKNVTGNLGFYENAFTSLSAVNLTSVGSTFAITGNLNLNNISFPILKTIGGGFQVQNNTVLTSVDFPVVESIGGAFDFYGAFDK